MKGVQDWKLAACIALGVGAMMSVEPMFEPALFGAQISGIIPTGVRAGLGAFVGLCIYYLLFRPQNSD